MANYYCADIVVKIDYIAVHFYIFDGRDYRYENSCKCIDFDETFNSLFTKGISGYFKELIIYIEDPLKEINTRKFLKRAINGLNWFFTNSGINAGIVKGNFIKPGFIKVDY